MGETRFGRENKPSDKQKQILLADVTKERRWPLSTPNSEVGNGQVAYVNQHCLAESKTIPFSGKLCLTAEFANSIRRRV